MEIADKMQGKDAIRLKNLTLVLDDIHRELIVGDVYIEELLENIHEQGRAINELKNAR